MKQTIRLNEQELKQLIREAIDMTGFPYDGDAVARNNWWKNRMEQDFPGIKVADNDYQKNYMDAHMNKEGDRIKKEKNKERYAKSKLKKQEGEKRRKEFKEYCINLQLDYLKEAEELIMFFESGAGMGNLANFGGMYRWSEYSEDTEYYTKLLKDLALKIEDGDRLFGSLYTDSDYPTELNQRITKMKEKLRDQLQTYHKYYDAKIEKMEKEHNLNETITRALKKVINETELSYDVDNFSGKFNKNTPEGIDPEGSLDDPNGGDPFGDERSEIVADYGGDEKAAETDYSWRMRDTGNYPGLDDYYRVGKGAVDRLSLIHI